MAEIIAVVGAVASFIQVADFGFKVVQRLKDFTSQTKDVPRSLRHITIKLPVLLATLKRSTQAILASNITDGVRRDLEAAVGDCQYEIESLLELLLKILPRQGHTRRKRIWKGVWSLRYDAKVRNKMATIEGYMQALNYYHVTIIPSSMSMTVSALPKPLPISTVPFHRNRGFVETKGLSELGQKLAMPGSHTALVGLGGSGKTQIALEYTYRLREHSPHTWVFWVDASTSTSLEAGYRSIAKLTRSLGWDSTNSNPMDLVNAWLCDSRNGPWLLVLDNLEDPTLLSTKFRPKASLVEDGTITDCRSFADMIPQSTNGSVLATSRIGIDSHLGAQMDKILVEAMEEKSALLLLNQGLNTRAQSSENAAKLVEMLGYLPLAIDLANSYIRNTSISVKDYISKFVDAMESAKREQYFSAPKHNRTPLSYTSHFVFQELQQRHPSAAHLLSLMSLFCSEGIPESLLKGNYPAFSGSLPAVEPTGPVDDDELEDEFDRDVSALMAFRLITMNTRNEFTMHRRVQSAVKDWLKLNHELERWKSIYMDTMHNAFSKGELYDKESGCQGPFSHAKAMPEYLSPKGKSSISWAQVIFFQAAEFCNGRKSRECGEPDG